MSDKFLSGSVCILSFIILIWEMIEVGVFNAGWFNTFIWSGLYFLKVRNE